MDCYVKKGSSKTPNINFNFFDGVLKISGRSLPEDATSLYSPLLESIDEYLNVAKPITNIDIYLDYFNTSTAKYLVTILKKFEELLCKNKDAVVNWKYEEDDDDMFEIVQEFQTLLKIPFKIIAFPSNEWFKNLQNYNHS